MSRYGEIEAMKAMDAIYLAKDYLMDGYSRSDAIDAACMDLGVSDKTKAKVISHIEENGIF